MLPNDIREDPSSEHGPVLPLEPARPRRGPLAGGWDADRAVEPPAQPKRCGPRGVARRPQARCRASRVSPRHPRPTRPAADPPPLPQIPLPCAPTAANGLPSPGPHRLRRDRGLLALSPGPALTLGRFPTPGRGLRPQLTPLPRLRSSRFSGFDGRPPCTPARPLHSAAVPGPSLHAVPPQGPRTGHPLPGRPSPRPSFHAPRGQPSAAALPRTGLAVRLR